MNEIQEMNRRKRIAFIRPKSWPLANQIVEGVIREQFPEHDVDLIDITALVMRRPDIVLINSVATVLLYGADLLAGRKKFKLAFWRTPYIFQQIRRLIRKRLASGNYSFSFQMQSLFDGSVPGIPHFLYTDHTHLENLNYQHGNKDLYSQKWIDLEKEIYQHTTLNFVRSSNVGRSMVENYSCPANKVILAYAGSNVNVSEVRSENKDFSSQHILFVGIDWERKGGPDLVEAFKLVLHKHPNARLTIVGAKPELQIPNCSVIGPVPADELDQYYQKAGVFCLPTYQEPFGIVFIEAMTARLPIVATRVGAIPELVQNGLNGRLVEPGDVQGLANALSELLDDPEMSRRFGERSYQLTRERYSWQAVGKQFRQNILSVLQ
jgi:glycosyltransferase involved in cell wall biosynthesis